MLMNRRHGKKQEYAQNETENYNSKYTVVQNKDIIYGISKSKCPQSMYMLLSDPILPKIWKLFYVLLTYFFPKILKIKPPEKVPVITPYSVQHLLVLHIINMPSTNKPSVTK